VDGYTRIVKLFLNKGAHVLNCGNLQQFLKLFKQYKYLVVCSLCGIILA